MPRLHLARLVVAFLIKNANTTTLDLLARVSVLEGIAGKQPGTWMKDKVPEEEIVEVFGNEVKDTWLSRRDSGLVTAVRRSLEPLLQGTTVTADDILQAALVGMGSTGEVTRLPLFHGVGKAPGFTVAKVKAGVLVPRDVLAVAKTYARRRAIDVLRAQARRPQIERVDGDELRPVADKKNHLRKQGGGFFRRGSEWANRGTHARAVAGSGGAMGDHMGLWARCSSSHGAFRPKLGHADPSTSSQDDDASCELSSA